MSFSSAFSTAFQLFPYVLYTVKAVEDVVQTAAPGSDKKQIILNATQAAAQVGEQVPQHTVSMVSTMIDTIVGDLNKLGIFKHGNTGNTGATGNATGSAANMAGDTGNAV